ncbi:MFS transporter [Streptomyces cocklensis]|jgi:EmrB/QacA subfamily drug resistance transporter|uniref:Puromycin resistance protein pur8 n=1 Tax=Actinacidiphila cocklensis TaxID=887465 RepID=A0A9W4DZ07_9ACTN|nr:MFS transporter [Actinacidiphila cocklensis]MDD1059348.1 MFS transporter [Actinacidiphila cocklensis]WSX76153.1 MFS transporter [Streptomyces sp. NBC_00899]CAG6396091.1 Puromycin resistance protein pur8 [Actinacidiphila cocklensis]
MSSPSAADVPVDRLTKSSAQDSPPGPPTEKANHRWWVLAVIAVAQLMVVLDATVVNIALPSAQKALDFSDGNRQWIVTAYSLSFGSLLLLGGRLADLVGRKIVFQVGVVGFAAASALAGAAQNFEILVTGRALQGLFGALLAPAALSLLNTTFTDAKERAKAFGIYGAIAGAGGGVGLLLGGVLTEHLSWRWTLYVNLIFAVVAFLGGMAFLRKGAPANRPKLDLPGTLLVTVGLFLVVFGFSNAEKHHWGSPMTWGFLVVGAVLVGAFSWWQTRAEHPLLPMRVLLDRNRGASFTVLAVSGAGMFGVFLFLTYYLQQSLNYSPVSTGLGFLPMIGALMVAAQLATNTLLPKLGPRAIVPLGMVMGAAGMAWLTTLDLSSTYAANILPPLLVIGFGLGLVIPAAMSVATERVGEQDAGVASAAVNTMQQVGGSIGTALLNTLAASAATSYLAHHTGKAALPNAALHSYSTAYWWSAALLAFGGVLSLFMYRSGRPAPSEQGAPAAVHM